jgi:hypothetical protein
MRYCDKCGVELDDSMERCPLCGLTSDESPGIDDIKPDHVLFKNRVIKDFESLSKSQQRKLLWELAGITLISGIVVTLIINFILTKNISWAKYNLTASLALYITITLFTFWRHKPLALFFGSLLSTSALLVLLDVFSSQGGWGIQLGLPILLSFYVLLLIVIWLVSLSRQKGFNILAIIFIAIGLFSICIEGSISYYLLRGFQLRWSLIVSASMIPISAILFFVHYRLKTGIDLRRFFHI